MPEKNDRTGEHFINKKELGGYEFIIIKYNNNKKVFVQFQDEYKAIVPTNYQACKNGSVKNPYHPSVYGVGYLGQGEYKAKINGKRTEYYKYWQGMLQRCYDNKCKNKEQTYKDCFANEETYCLQNWGRWFEDNYYEVEGETLQLDKDILVKGNKEYRFDRMIFVPQRINLLFIKRDSERGDCPIGVSYNKNANKYVAYCGTNKDKVEYLGLYNTEEEAFKIYKEFKEQYIKQIADEYKDKIPQELYDAMYRWEVEIND